METLRLYDYVASANCFKVRLLLATLGRPYERVPVDIFAGETLGDDYYRINPARTTPVLEVGEGKFLPESNAILSYLAEGTRLRRWAACGSASSPAVSDPMNDLEPYPANARAGASISVYDPVKES
jgi:glutathione S-transferase